jgi:hypothetical protein
MSIVLVGSTSGSVTLQEPAVAGTTVLTLPAVSGTVITTGSSGQSIPKAALPTGSVLQVVSAVMTGGIFSTSSGSFVDVGFSATITPTSATSRILILFNSGGITRPAVANECLRLRIVRGSSTVVYGGDNLIFSSSATQFSDFPSSYQCVDSPATTSATTYKIQMETRLNNSCSMNGGATNNPATLQLLEIAS